VQFNCQFIHNADELSVSTIATDQVPQFRADQDLFVYIEYPLS